MLRRLGRSLRYVVSKFEQVPEADPEYHNSTYLGRCRTTVCKCPWRALTYERYWYVREQVERIGEQVWGVSNLTTVLKYLFTR